MSQTGVVLDDYCRWCSQPPNYLVIHYGPCPCVKAIEYNPNGTIRRVEFQEEQQAAPIEVNIDWTFDVEAEHLPASSRA